MNRNGLKRIKAAAVLIAVLLMMNVQMLTAFAATARIAFSDPTVKVGDEVSVTMKITTGDGQLGKADVMLAYDSSMLEFVSGTEASGGAGSIKVSGASDTSKPAEMKFTLKFKAKQAGKAKITVSDQEIYDLDGQAVTVNQQGSSAVTITPLATYSKEASLASLQISPGTLTPEFSADVEEYTATVGGDVDKIIVSAPSSDSKAKVVISGNDNLQPGENKIVCKVTAEDGETVKNYTITVTKTEGSQPSGQPGTAPADGVKVQTIAKSVTIVPLDADVKVPAGLVENSLTINGEKVQGWIAEGEGQQEYCVVYAVNADGEKNFYRYDLKERTMQRYFDAASGAKQDVLSQIEDYNQLVHDYDMRFIIIMALIGVCVVLFIIILVLLFKRGGHNGPYDDDDEDMEDDEDKELFGRRVSKEERYLRGLEAEEEEALAREEERLERELSGKAVPSARTAGAGKDGAPARAAQAGKGGAPEQAGKTAQAGKGAAPAQNGKTAAAGRGGASAQSGKAVSSERGGASAQAGKTAASERGGASVQSGKTAAVKAVPSGKSMKAVPAGRPVSQPAVEDDDDDFEILDI